MQLARGSDLTYCTNIHPANGWPEVLASLERFGPALKAGLNPQSPFALGLRLAADEAVELLTPGKLAGFRAFLEQHGLYVALINGFPYGNFHDTPVKAQVFAPDWRTQQRLIYTNNLFDILSALLPAGMDGGVSTAPLSYKGWVRPDDETGWAAILPNVLQAARYASHIKQRTGQSLHLDIEPEPNGLVENTREFIDFFHRLLRFAPAADEALLREHVTSCFDICHAAVEYEDPAEALDALHREGIRVGRVQISSALRIAVPSDASARKTLSESLGQFTDPVYLHQVIEQSEDGTLRLYSDLADALPFLDQSGGKEWRVHFHVPLFVDRFANFGSTQNVIVEVLRRWRERPFTTHLEIETYTWSILPVELKLDLLSSIDREYRWVLDQL